METKDQAFIDYLSKEGKSITTQGQYNLIVNQYLEFMEKNHLVLSVESVNSFIGCFDLDATKKKNLSIIRAYLKFLESPIFFQLKDVE